jgi:hypothetical protein
MFRQAASAGYNSLEINEKWEQIQKISKWKAGKEKNEACIAFPWISKKGNDVIRKEPFDKDPSKIQSTTQKPPKKLAVEERQNCQIAKFPDKVLVVRGPTIYSS